MKQSAHRDRTANAAPAPDTASLWHDRSAQWLAAAAVALFVAAPLIPSESAAPLGTHVVLVMAWFPVACGCLVRQLWRPGFPGAIGRVDGAVLLFLLAHSVSALVMLRAGQPRSTLNALWLWIAYGLMYFCGRHLFRSGQAQRAAVGALLAVAFGLAVFGFYQVTYSNPRLRAEYARDPERALHQAGLDAPAGSPQRAQFENRLASTEPIGSFALTNSLAGYLTPAVILLLSALGSFRERAAGRWRNVLGMLLMLLIVVGCLLLTKSRSAYAALIVGVVLLAISRALPRTWFRGSLLTGVAILLVVTTFAAARLGGLDREVITEASKSLLYRLQYWRATCDMISDRPWFGCGPGNFQAYYTSCKVPEASETIADPHNFLLEIAATAGLPSLTLFVLAGVALAAVMSRRHDAFASVEVAQPTRFPTSISPISVYVGVVVGFLLTFPAGWAGGMAPDLALIWTALPAAGVALGCLHAWVGHGRLSAWPLGVAGVALLVNFLAAGGIGYPGVGLLVWWLAALAVNIVGDHPRQDSREPVAESRWDWRRALALVLLLLLAAACFLTMYRPVLRAQQCLAEARRATSESASEQLILAAAQADSWSAEPWEILADLRSRRWLANPDQPHLAEFFTSQNELLERNRHAAQVQRRCGDRLLEMYAASQLAELGTAAVQAYTRAVEYYPNSAMLRAQLAWACYVTGSENEARRQADEALRLDALMPHAELKLANQRVVVDYVVDSPPDKGPGRTDSNAEQLMLRLRKVKDR